MATPDWIASTEQIIGASHPTLTDTKNRCGQTIQTMLEIGHDSNGRHLLQDYTLVGEIDTYTGDDSASRTITLSLATLTPKVVMIFADAAQKTLDKLDVLSGDYAFNRATSGIALQSYLSVADGSFTIKTATYNVSGTTYYYCVLGIDNTATYTGDAGAGSDPTWMTSGNISTAPMIGSNDATVSQTLNSANAVESEIWTAFTHEHGADGTHSTDPYTGFYRIETGSYAGNGGGDRAITMTNSIDVKYLGIINVNDSGLTYNFTSKSETMSSNDAKIEPTAAFNTLSIESLGTGTFTVKTNCNVSGFTHYWFAIGA